MLHLPDTLEYMDITYNCSLHYHEWPSKSTYEMERRHRLPGGTFPSFSRPGGISPCFCNPGGCPSASDGTIHKPVDKSAIRQHRAPLLLIAVTPFFPLFIGSALQTSAPFFILLHCVVPYFNREKCNRKSEISGQDRSDNIPCTKEIIGNDGEEEKNAEQAHTNRCDP